MPEGLLFFVKPFNQFVQRSKYGGAICWTFNYMINGMGERTLLETSVNMPTSSTDIGAAFQIKLMWFWSFQVGKLTEGPCLTQILGRLHKIYVSGTVLQRIYSSIMAMRFSVMFTFQLHNTKSQTLPAPHCRNGNCNYVWAVGGPLLTQKSPTCVYISQKFQ